MNTDDSVTHNVTLNQIAELKDRCSSLEAEVSRQNAMLEELGKQLSNLTDRFNYHVELPTQPMLQDSPSRFAMNTKQAEFSRGIVRDTEVPR